MYYITFHSMVIQNYTYLFSVDKINGCYVVKYIYICLIWKELLLRPVFRLEILSLTMSKQPRKKGILNKFCKEALSIHLIFILFCLLWGKLRRNYIIKRFYLQAPYFFFMLSSVILNEKFFFFTISDLIHKEEIYVAPTS